LAPGIESESVQKIRELKKSYYGEMMSFIKPNQELVDFLRMMAPLHVTALVTTAQSANAKHVLREAKLEGLFNYSIYGDDVKRQKPDPEAYNKALALTGLAPEEVIAFEDSVAGVEAATTAGLRVIRVAAQ
jgi:HAD superfamily hydrolase (TIGR01509 family)